MAKRFTDTNKYKKPFIRGLQGAYKLLWDYLYHDCDHAGVWIVDFEIAQIYIGSDMEVYRDVAIDVFDDKIIVFDDGTKWFIPSFIEFQYGELNTNNRAHKSVIDILSKHNLYNLDKGLISPLEGCKDKDKDKELDKDKEPKEKPKDKFSNFYNDEYLKTVLDTLKDYNTRLDFESIKIEADKFVKKLKVTTDTSKESHEYNSHFFNLMKKNFRKSNTVQNTKPSNRINHDTDF